MDNAIAHIIIEGTAPDLVGLSKLFPMGRGDLQVEAPIGVKVEPQVNGYKVDTFATVTTKATGKLVLEALQQLSSDRFKQDSINFIIEMLNASGFVCDPEFRPVRGLSWGISKAGGGSYGVPSDPNKSYRKRTSLGRVPQHLDMAVKVAEAIRSNETVRRVFRILQDPNPGWVGYNMVLEEIAFHEGIPVSKLEEIDLAPKGFISKFQNSANNARELNQKPRHGQKIKEKPNKSPKITLFVAMATVRDIVHNWIFSFQSEENSV